MALNTIYNSIDAKVFEGVKDLEKASEVWIRLCEAYEGTKVVKSAKMYMLKNELNNFKMKDDESILEMFHPLQVIVNDLKSFRVKTDDKDFCHKFLMCFPRKFKTLRSILFRGALDDMSPNKVLGEVLNEDQYNSNGEEEKKDKKDKKEKSVAFKASSSKGKSKKEASSEDDDEFDEEAMALLFRKIGKFMKKRGYGARKRRDHMKDNLRLCFEYKSLDHMVADCPHKRDDDDKKKKKKDKEEKKEKKMTFKKNKKGSGYVVTWDSDGSNDSDDDSSDDEKKAIKKAFASIAIHNNMMLVMMMPYGKAH
jgi:hypothetical protein